MAGRVVGWVLVAAMALVGLGACSEPISKATRDTDDRDAGLVARDYFRALAVGQSTSKVGLDDAYSMLLPAQRAAIAQTFYTGCVLQEENQGNDDHAQVRKIEDNDHVVPPGYTHSLPTKTVWVTLPADYNKAPDWYGKLRVSRDSGRWYVSVADAAFHDYMAGNCELGIWERPPVDPNAPLPTVVTIPAGTRP